VTGESFEQALDERPDDWASRLVYADWLDDQGEYALAQAQRWMAGQHKCPEGSFVTAAGPRFVWFNGEAGRRGEGYEEDGWWYHLEEGEEARQGAPEAALPEEVFARLRPGETSSDRFLGEPMLWCAYPTRRLAERDLALALGEDAFP
jgi:uncharacterized protein (TIGR02996 family)